MKPLRPCPGSTARFAATALAVTWLPSAAAAPWAVPYDHDLFPTADGAVPPYYRVVDALPAPQASPRAWSPSLTPDALLVPREGTVELPLDGTASAVRVTLAAHGALDARGVAGDLELVYADGRSQISRLLVGETLWPAFAGATGRGATPVAIGENPSGDTLTAAAVTLPTSWPDAPLRTLRVRSRGALTLAVLALEPVAAPAGLVHTGGGPGWYDFAPTALPTALLPAAPSTADRGPLRVEGDHLVTAVGERARLWGVNLVGRAAVPAPDRADAVAGMLAALGFDLVRLHHLDADGVLPAPERGQPDQPIYAPEALDRLDRFVAALGARGVYHVVEIMTHRAFRAGEGVPATAGVPLGHKYATAYWPEWAAAEKAQARAIWGRPNPHTGAPHLADPHVAWVELANEDSLVSAWASGNLEQLPPAHRARLDTLWNAWLRREYGTDARVAAAWSGGTRAGLGLGEALALDSVAREPADRRATQRWPLARAVDLVRFYAELEAAHTAEMATFVRDELGWRGPLVCNTALGAPAAEALLAACDVVDLHLYWDPIAESTAFFDRSFLARPTEGRFLEKLAGCQRGRACVVGELQHSWPNRYGFEAPLTWAALGSRQGWDAVTWFAWSHADVRDDPDGPDGALDLEGRWNAWVQLPAAAALFRAGAVAEADPTWTRWWSPDGLQRELAEAPGIWADEALQPWSYLTRRVRSAFDPHPPADAPPGAGAPLDRGGLTWAPDDQRFTIDVERVQALIGAPGAPPTARLDARVDRAAAVSLTALDGGDLGSATRALLVAVGRCERDGTVWQADEGGLAVLGTGVARLERLGGEVRLNAARRPRVWALDADGHRGEEVRLERRPGGWWALPLGGQLTPWWEVELPPRR